MKKIIICLTAFLLISLTACSFETSSSTSVSTTINGTTTTTETVTENGTTTTTTTVTEDPTGLRARWPELFTNGAEGLSSADKEVYFVYNNTDTDSSLGAFMIVDHETQELEVYAFGDIEEEDNHLIIHDVDGQESLPFVLESNDEGMTVTFKDGDEAFLEYMDLDTVIDQMIGIWEVQQEAYQAAH